MILLFPDWYLLSVAWTPRVISGALRVAYEIHVICHISMWSEQWHNLYCIIYSINKEMHACLKIIFADLKQPVTQRLNQRVSSEVVKDTPKSIRFTPRASHRWFASIKFSGSRSEWTTPETFRASKSVSNCRDKWHRRIKKPLTRVLERIKKKCG